MGPDKMDRHQFFEIFTGNKKRISISNKCPGCGIVVSRDAIQKNVLIKLKDSEKLKQFILLCDNCRKGKYDSIHF